MALRRRSSQRPAGWKSGYSSNTSSETMNARQSLMDELETAVRHGSSDQRTDTLRRVTDLFLIAPEHYDKEQVALFGDVLTQMTARVETKARAELAKRLAP